MSIGIWQLIIVAVIVVLLFGSGKVSDLMGDVAKGIKNFREGMKDEQEPPKVIGSNTQTHTQAPEHQDQAKDKAGQ